MNALELPRKALVLWIGMILAAGLSLLGASLPAPASLLAWAPVLAMGELFWFRTFGRRATISTAMVVHLAALALLPPQQAALLAAASSLLADGLVQRKPLVKCAYNSTLIAVTMRLAALPLQLGAGLLPSGVPPALRAGEFLLAGLVYWVVNRAGVTGIVCAAEEVSFAQAWRENFGFGYELLSAGVQLVVAGILVVIWPIVGPPGLLGMGLLCFFISDSYRKRNQLETLRGEDRDRRNAA